MKKNFTFLLASMLIAGFLGLSVASAQIRTPPVMPVPQRIPPVMQTPQAPSTPSVVQSPAGGGYSYRPLFVNTQTETQVVQTTTETPVVKSPKKIDLTNAEYTGPCKPPYLCDSISI